MGAVASWAAENPQHSEEITGSEVIAGAPATLTGSIRTPIDTLARKQSGSLFDLGLMGKKTALLQLLTAVSAEGVIAPHIFAIVTAANQAREELLEEEGGREEEVRALDSLLLALFTFRRTAHRLRLPGTTESSGTSAASATAPPSRSARRALHRCSGHSLPSLLTPLSLPTPLMPPPPSPPP